MTTNVAPDLKKNSNGSFWLGIFLVVMGIAAILLPNISTIVAETWLALILVSSGVGKLLYAFRTRDEEGFIWKLLLSVLYIVAGVMLFTAPRTGIITLTLLLGSFLLTEGVFELLLAFRLRPQRNWAWVLVDGILTLVVGLMIWAQWPFNAPWVIGILLGVSILSTGVSRLMLSFNAPNLPNSSDQAASV
jgi:uncharacterized membrane protein HdeD (DUF308 family)